MNKLLLPLLTATLLASTGATLAAGELTYVVNNESAKYDPGTTAETFAAPIIGNTFEGLVRFDKEGEVIPALAESWEVSEDGLNYTFHLRDAKWSDGKPVTAGDFVYAWDRVLDPATGAMNSAMLYPIVGAEEHYADAGKGDIAISAPDDKTLTFTLKARVPYMMQLLTYTTFFPVRQDVVEADPEGWTRDPATFIGTGPFRVTEFNAGKSVVFEKNPNYYDADAVSLDKLTFRLIPEPATALAAMEAGQVDGIESVPAPEIPRLSVESDAFMVVPALGTTYAFFNPHQAPLDDVRVRKALSMAIDREEIVEFVLQSADVPAIALVPYGINVNGEDFRDGTDDFGLATTAQPEAAQALLADAGYPNGEGFPDTVFVTYSSPPIEKLLEAIQQMWKKNLNIDVNIQATEWQVFYPEVQKVEYQIAQMGWGADYPHPMTFLDNFVTGSPNNLANWSNPEYDAAIAAAKATGDEAESLAEMRKAEAIMMNDHVILPEYHRNNYMMMSPKVQGFWRSTLNVPYFRDASIAE
ncbi:peptide ABC transporter substrate-binding protein [Devosia rhodophyticola]|uniref:Peptide ABC transporter substrate-binding protein n=1 Tax=Devosia rhodophyticola TaxID=3026423 RepID=A0ABY7YY58_9HYPH|nr:peptide ABC transporter substrate-binding protein [Devosia rhodophyticola]WDR06157.1 peptide ABC transporter substrate-binding protein [Devosia rhodophyticola]